MTFRQWMNESSELSKRRMDMLVERFSVQELIEYRDNYEKNRKLINKMLMVLEMFIIFSLLILCVLEGLSVVEKIDTTWGYLFGFGISMLVFTPSGSYERKLTKAIEERCVRELELKK